MPTKKTPKTPAADDDLDDLFGEPDKSSDSAPAKPKPASVTDDADDLAAEPADDMPAATDQKESAKPAGDDFDDLFEDEPKPGRKSASAEPAAGDMAELVDQLTADDGLMRNEADSAQAGPQAPADFSAETGVAAEMAPSADSTIGDQIQAETSAAELRLWTDNTGNYSIRARLVVVLDGKVRLQKESGRFTTVSFGRLSKPDLAFVQGLVSTIASTAVDRGAEF